MTAGQQGLPGSGSSSAFLYEAAGIEAGCPHKMPFQTDPIPVIKISPVSFCRQKLYRRPADFVKLCSGSTEDILFCLFCAVYCAAAELHARILRMASLSYRRFVGTTGTASRALPRSGYEQHKSRLPEAGGILQLQAEPFSGRKAGSGSLVPHASAAVMMAIL